MGFTPEQRMRGGQTRCAKLTAEQQAAYGHLGYLKTTSLYGHEKWAEAVIQRQRSNPSRLEQAAMQLLDELDWHPVHIYQPWPDSRATVDFADVVERIVIEIRGGIHFNKLSNDPNGSFFDWKVSRLRSEGWQVIVIDCPNNKLPADTRSRLMAVAPTNLPF